MAKLTIVLQGNTLSDSSRPKAAPSVVEHYYTMYNNASFVFDIGGSRVRSKKKKQATFNRTHDVSASVKHLATSLSLAVGAEKGGGKKNRAGRYL